MAKSVSLKYSYKLVREACEQPKPIKVLPEQ